MSRIPYPINPATGPMDYEKIVERIEIEQLLLLLKGQSVRLEEIRRMGKTMLIQKLAYKTEKEELNHKAVYFMLQGTADVSNLTDVLLDELRKEEKYSKLKIAFNKVTKLYNKLRPTENIDIFKVSFSLPEYKEFWKDALTACIEDIAERSYENNNEVFTIILDEFPVMLWDWIQNGKANEAIELLDFFRKLRYDLKEKGKIRFLICGSIGMNVVLHYLQQKHRYTGEPFNDFEIFSLGSMTKEDAVFLCECLCLSDFTVDENKKNELLQLILDKSEQLPYFITKIFSYIQINCQSIISVESIEEAYLDITENTSNSASEIFNQLSSRLQNYYPEIQKTAHNILNFICQQTDYISEDEILNKNEIEKIELNEILSILTKEQYFKRKMIDGKRNYTFKYKIIQQWWKTNKA